MEYKYKKISLHNLIKKINSSDKSNMYSKFIEKYILNYLSKFKINSFEQFINSNTSHLDFFKKYDSDAKIYFSYLTDKQNKKIIAIEKTIMMNEKFFDIKYFNDIVEQKDNVLYGINLFVDEDYRGKSLCKHLLSRIKLNAKKNNVKYIVSDIHDENIPSIKCHLSQDFKKLNVLSYKNTYFYIAIL